MSRELRGEKGTCHCCKGRDGSKEMPYRKAQWFGPPCWFWGRQRATMPHPDQDCYLKNEEIGWKPPGKRLQKFSSFRWWCRNFNLKGLKERETFSDWVGGWVQKIPRDLWLLRDLSVERHAWSYTRCMFPTRAVKKNTAFITKHLTIWRFFIGDLLPWMDPVPYWGLNVKKSLFPSWQKHHA